MAASASFGLALIKRIAQLVPSPRIHRHRYYGVLAPNSPLRAAVTALAQTPVPACKPAAEHANVNAASGSGGTALVPGGAGSAAPLIARINEVFALICPNCGGQMRTIAFITFSALLGEPDTRGPDRRPGCFLRPNFGGHTWGQVVERTIL